MQLGFNENVVHKNAVYHIQTEDGGRKNPVITSLLFKEGLIITSKRTNYSDIITFDKLDKVVKDIMLEQHGTILKNLKDGMYDNKDQLSAPKKPTAAEKIIEKGSGPVVIEKSLDDIILEYLSTSPKEKDAL